ncbi:MAG: helix-turn-helix domain-containing protein, partial [Myxococcales bacterium]|nr:TetR/AcrR family transcriptional regulator [Polyangiaceae bacterium]MDW8251432.1 helix-turn-helix domain-containing protein [Myxococcales bacterium]
RAARGVGTGREAILASATRLFAEQGYEATSVQEVAAEVGVTKQAVLHHFASKEELRQAVLDGLLAHWNETLPKLLEAATGSGNRFDAVFGELWRFFLEDSDRARIFVREMLDRPEEMRKLLSGPVRPWLKMVASYIRAGCQAGRHHGDVDPEAYVVATLLMVIATAASKAVMGAALEGDEMGRLEREVCRVARTALFVETCKDAQVRRNPPRSTRSRGVQRG